MDKTKDPDVTAITRRANSTENNYAISTDVLEIQARGLSARFGMALPLAKVVAEIAYAVRDRNAGGQA